MIEYPDMSTLRLDESSPQSKPDGPRAGGLSTRPVPGVFGVARHLPRNHVHRQSVDGRFVAGIHRDKHVVLHGDSKQGKSTVWRVALEGENPLVVPSAISTTRAQIHAAILQRAGASVTLSERSAPSGARALLVEIPTKPIPAPGRSPSEGADDPRGLSRSPIRFPTNGASRRPAGCFEVDPLAPAEIAGILEVLDGPGVRRFVVIEDFHRLSPEVQEGVVSDLKVFHDFSRLLFVVVMIDQRDEHGALPDRDVFRTNSELRDRTVMVDVNPWSEEELHEVMVKGERLLNVTFPDDVKAAVLDHARGNVGRLQVLCQSLCHRADVWGPQKTLREVGRRKDVHDILFQDFNLPRG